jgi:hypothetical protein
MLMDYAPVVGAVGAVQELYNFIGSGQTAEIGTTVCVMPFTLVVRHAMFASFVALYTAWFAIEALMPANLAST